MTIKNFPRIYSLSTIGIRNHQSVDYRFHQFRTDFTGDSGVGKTMIADILQLILVGEREFQSATEAYSEREARKLILQRYGYVFLNIEVALNQYLVIGMFISNTSVDPFIIQQGFGWNEYTPLSSPFLHRQMLFNDNIIDIDTLCERLTDAHCKKFSLKRYHELLLNYNILPIDLRNEKELKNYAQIIRSFSRGRGFKNDPEWLKQFFFNDDKEKEIYENFQRHLTDIDSDLKDHRRNKETLTEVSYKESSLLELKKLKDEKDEKEIEYLEAKILFHNGNIEKYKKDLIENQNDQMASNYLICLLILRKNKSELDSLEKNVREAGDKIKRIEEISEEVRQAKQNISEYKLKKHPITIRDKHPHKYRPICRLY
jgi:dephospho-CoA kinase